MHAKSKIVIVGGGIGGLTTALALHKKGFTNIEVLERRTETQSVGAGFVLWSNAGWVLDQLGILNEISEFGGRLKKMKRLTNNGENLGEINIHQIDTAIGHPSYAVSKAQFQLYLQKKVTEKGISLQNNKTITAIKEHETTKKAFLKLDDNTVIESEIIICADGRMNSAGRKYVQGKNQPVYQNYINWVGILESNDSLPITNDVLDYWGCGERFGIVPVNKNKLYWAGCKTLPANWMNTESTDKKELLKIFENWPHPIKSIIEKTQDKNIKRIPVYDQDPNPDWFRNNVCLLGDAAHASLPTSGQGACQAIEDAWHLANQLVHFNTLKESFEAYRNIRFEKTAAITISGRNLAESLFSTDEEYCQERNNKAKLTDYKKSANEISSFWSKGLI